MPFLNRVAPMRVAKSLALAAAIALVAPGLALAQGKKNPAPAPAPAPAQQQAPAGPTVVKVKAEPSQPEWTKVCGEDKVHNKTICYTTRDFVSDQGQPVLAMAVYEVKGSPDRIVRFLMPLGLLLEPGIRFGVDKGQPVEGKFAICFPNGCFAEGHVKESEIASIKKGQFMNVSVQNQAANVVTFQVPLEGFGKAFDGKPIDPKVLAERQQKMQELLQKRADEMRKKIEDEQSKEAAPAKKK